MVDKNQRDGANSLEELSPFDMMPFAVHFEVHDDSTWNNSFRRYKTLAHARSAVSALHASWPGSRAYGVTYYEWKVSTNAWEEIRGQK